MPVGTLAAPGIVDWSKTKFMSGGREVPYTVREGRVHYKAKLIAPVKSPRAEDLVVFSCTVPAGQTFRIDAVSGAPSAKSALTRKAGRLVISYPNLEVTIDEKTGMLDGFQAFGEQMVTGHLETRFFKLPGKRLELNGYVESVPPPSGVTVANKKPMRSPVVRFVSSSSTPAMTEINFVLDSRDRLMLALTYRVHASGLVEIWSDERPWKGQSPWMDHCVEYGLPLAGDKEPLYNSLNRAPHNGFQDFTAVVRYADTIHKGKQAMVLELGEQTVNGRRWNRQLYTAPIGKAAKCEDLITLATEGYALDVKPASTKIRGKVVRVAYPKGAAAAAGKIADALNKAGVQAKTTETKAGGVANGITFRLADKPGAAGIEGDGFRMETGKDQGIMISAGTQFGLMQAGLRVAKNLSANTDGCVSIPLIAGNPAVDVRAGGLGGIPSTGDIGFGSDADWERQFDGLIDSGINIIGCLGMWGNWKMPVSYKYMPELKSDSANAFDQSTGTSFREFNKHREHGLKLLDYLHGRGVKVWLWMPIGCVPTTYAKVHPEAMSRNLGHESMTSDRIPCSTDPLYYKYIDALVTELLETYPIDGIIMIRDDNGGRCECKRCTEAIAKSKTKDTVWEQYLIMHSLLRSKGFKGPIAVYPYMDKYRLGLHNLLPEDMYIVGHGSGQAMLTRNYDFFCPMGDTWIDSQFAGFRFAPSARMKRLLGDRGSFWLGGAYYGTELPLESIGYFGWEPTSSVNTFRYQWAAREFGRNRSLCFLKMNEARERLWDLYQWPTDPNDWTRLSAADRKRASKDCAFWLDQFRTRVDELAEATRGQDYAKWFAHVRLFGTFFEYQVKRLEYTSEISEIVNSNRHLVNTSGTLPEDLRSRIIEAYKAIYDLRIAYDQKMAEVPGEMIKDTRDPGTVYTHKEYGLCWGSSLRWVKDMKEFAGTINVQPVQIRTGKPFTLKIKLRNTGVAPWRPGVKHRLELAGDAEKLGLPKTWDPGDVWMVFGDTRVIELQGNAPASAGQGEVKLRFYGPMGPSLAVPGPAVFIDETMTMAWKRGEPDDQQSQ